MNSDFEAQRAANAIQERQASALEWIAASLERIADQLEGTPPAEFSDGEGLDAE